MVFQISAQSDRSFRKRRAPETGSLRFPVHFLYHGSYQYVRSIKSLILLCIIQSDIIGKPNTANRTVIKLLSSAPIAYIFPETENPPDTTGHNGQQQIGYGGIVFSCPVIDITEYLYPCNQIVNTAGYNGQHNNAKYTSSSHTGTSLVV